MTEDKEKNKQLINRFLSVHPASSPSFTADGKRILFIMNMGMAPQVWSTPFIVGERILWPEALTFGEERIQGFWPSPVKAEEFIYASDFGGNENAQLFLHRGGAQDTCLTPSESKVMHLFGQWSKDGKRIVYSSNKRHPGYFDLYLRSLDGEEKLIWKNDSYGHPGCVLISPDEKKIYLSREETTFRSALLEIDVASGAARSLAVPGQEARYGFLAGDEKGRSLLLVTDVGSDFTYIARLYLASGSLEPVVALDCDIEAFMLTRDGQTIIFSANREGANELYSLDLASGERKMAPLPKEVNGVIGEVSPFILNLGADISPDGRRVAFTFTTPICDSNIYTWDRESNAVYPLTKGPMGGFRPSDLQRPEVVRYPTFDGRQIPGLLYHPPAEFNGPRPVVAIVHGGPAGQSKQVFNFFAQMLLANGFAVFLPNVRGSMGYGKTYTVLDEVEKRMDSVADLAYAAKWLKTRPELDGKRLAVYGGSYGGFMVLAALTHYPDLWAAGIDVVGIGNFATFIENTSEYRRAHREAEYGTLPRDRALLESFAPMNHLDKIVAPLMVLHGANDPRVPLSESLRLVEALEKRGIPVEKMIFDDEGHGIVKDKNKLKAYPAMVEFLLKHLG